MHELIASLEHKKDALHPNCLRLFDLGIKYIEKEFQTRIFCEIQLNSQVSQAQLMLMNARMQQWYNSPEYKDVMLYKIVSHFKICMNSY
jgi:hypothetical protein